MGLRAAEGGNGGLHEWSRGKCFRDLVDGVVEQVQAYP